MRQQNRLRPRYRRSAPLAALPCALFVLGAAPAVAAQAVEPALRLSRTLSMPGADFPAEERMLLRVEYQAAQSRASEADLVGDILLRVGRINGMIGDINRMVATSPASGPAPPVVPAATPPPPAIHPATIATRDEGSTEGSGGTMALRALMASVIIFLFWLLGKRHNYIKAQRLKVAAPAAASGPAATPTVIPAGDGLVAMPAPATPTAGEGRMARRSRAPASPALQEHPASVAVANAHDHAAVVAAEAAAGGAAPMANAAIEFERVTPAAAQAPTGEPAPPDFDAHADQALELAEIMVSMGLAQGAADALSERIRNNPRRALFHWLKLLEVYRQAQMKEDFDRAAQELRQAFNVRPAGWVAGPGSISIEDFPHLVDKLMQLWPTPECTGFLNGLLEDNRGGTRDGLPQSVAEEILLLERILNAEAVVDAP